MTDDFRHFTFSAWVRMATRFASNTGHRPVRTGSGGTYPHEHDVGDFADDAEGKRAFVRFVRGMAHNNSSVFNIDSGKALIAYAEGLAADLGGVQ